MLHDGPPVEPRLSSSVLLVRPGEPWEVLLLRRPGGADFAPGAWVFPGGSVHGADADQPDPLRAAALRELFEEAGVLIGRGARGAIRADELTQVRQLLAQGRSWSEALTTVGITLAPDRLSLFTRWITPEQVRKRFDTSFYLARVPPGQEIHPQPGEIEEWRWIVPSVALEDDTITLVFATRRILESVARERDPARLIARVRRRRSIATVTPRIIQTPDGGSEIVV